MNILSYQDFLFEEYGIDFEGKAKYPHIKVLIGLTRFTEI